MKPIQEAVLRLLVGGSMSAVDLYQSFHDGDDGSRDIYGGGTDTTDQDRWINKHVKPLVRSRKAKLVDDTYEITDAGRSALGAVKPVNPDDALSTTGGYGRIGERSDEFGISDDPPTAMIVQPDGTFKDYKGNVVGGVNFAGVEIKATFIDEEIPVTGGTMRLYSDGNGSVQLDKGDN